jgi:hypothetical protein
VPRYSGTRDAALPRAPSTGSTRRSAGVEEMAGRGIEHQSTLPLSPSS